MDQTAKVHRAPKTFTAIRRKASQFGDSEFGPFILLVANIALIYGIALIILRATGRL